MYVSALTQCEKRDADGELRTHFHGASHSSQTQLTALQCLGPYGPRAANRRRYRGMGVCSPAMTETTPGGGSVGGVTLHTAQVHTSHVCNDYLGDSCLTQLIVIFIYLFLKNRRRDDPLRDEVTVNKNVFFYDPTYKSPP